MNNHLSIFTKPYFKDLPINTKYQLVESYLSQIYKVLNQAVEQHSRTIVFHTVLRFPLDISFAQSNGDCISRFIDSFKSQVKADQSKRVRSGKRVHKTAIRYVWCCEQSLSENEHYHIFILMNADSYRSMGSYESPIAGQLFYMLNTAWGRAIGVDTQTNRGLVHLSGSSVNIDINTDSDSPIYDRYIGSNVSVIDSVFHWMSYLAKHETKQYGNGGRNFGCSQR